MTKKTIRRAFLGTILGLALLVAAGIAVSIFDTTEKRLVFSTFKDLLPLTLAIAAAWIGYCVQRRTAYQQQLRVLWSNLVCAVQHAAAYTQMTRPTQPEYRAVLVRLSIAIDEFRGVFCNLGEDTERPGYYPFEPIKDIHRLVSELGYEENFKAPQADAACRKIQALWKDVRAVILKEFDREEPSWPHSHWTDEQKGAVYDENDITKGEA